MAQQVQNKHARRCVPEIGSNPFFASHVTLACIVIGKETIENSKSILGRHAPVASSVEHPQTKYQNGNSINDQQLLQTYLGT